MLVWLALAAAAAASAIPQAESPFAARRRAMVDEQIAARGVRDDRVLDVRFVPMTGEILKAP